MTIIPNTDNNALHLMYNDNEEFDEFILVKHEKALQVLDPNKLIRVFSSGSVPLDIIAYLCEVSKHCNGLNWELHDDRDAWNHLLEKTRKDKDLRIYLSYDTRGEKK